ncbi:hypothetical protein HRED_03639 [Candidatus Haloredivivus sp. G17]|nr:hypothetical protein HRED_03639 [Candidatus Haloredivivus sp. G17]
MDEDELNEISKEISDRDNEYLNESDHKIIDFFSNEANQPGIKEVINISGVLTNVLGLVDEMDIKSYCLTPNIESTAYFWVYLNIYELILDTLSKNILQYYRQQDDLSKARKNSMKELEKKVEKGEHFSSGKIESELVGLNIIEHKNNSIFSKDRARAMRNSLGHANVFYDDSSGDVVFSNGERYSFDEFKIEFEIIFQFALEWAFQLNDQSSDVTQTISDGFKAMSSEIDRSLLEFTRRDGDWEKVLLHILEE